MKTLAKLAFVGGSVWCALDSSAALAGFPATLELGDLRPEDGGDGRYGFVLNSSTPINSSGAGPVKAFIVRDVNGDGHPDLIVVVPGADGTAPAVGIGFVVFGRDDFPARLDLDALSGGDGFDMVIGDSAVAGSELGGFLAPAGDVNGDGIGDLFVSSYYAPYVLFGRAAGSPFPAHVTLDALTGADGFRVVLAPTATGSTYVYSTDAGIDVNGDGIDDLLITESAPPGDDFSAAGVVYFADGRAGGFDATLDLQSLDGSNGYRLDGDPQRNGLGTSLSGQADIDQDGHVDLVTIDSADSTRGVVVFGDGGVPPAITPLPTLDGISGFEFRGDAESNYTAAAGGDLNGDGWPDMVFCEGIDSPSGNRTAYVVFGGPRPFPASLGPADLDGSNGFAYLAETPSSEDHANARFIGDINGDGIDDLAIWTASFAPPGISRSIVHVIYGRRDGFPAAFDESMLDGVHGFRIDGLGSIGAYIDDVAGSGDLNGDGIDDLVITANSPAGDGTGVDVAYVLYGRESSLFANGFEVAAGDASKRHRRYAARTGNALNRQGSGDARDDRVGGDTPRFQQESDASLPSGHRGT